jgi:parvulin-like peptidyl-prolyl isomerase
VRQAEQREGQAQTQIISLTTERDQLRDQMEQARVKEAQAQGQLTAITASAKIPSTMPSTVAQRFASVFFGD